MEAIDSENNELGGPLREALGRMRWSARKREASGMGKNISGSWDVPAGRRVNKKRSSHLKQNGSNGSRVERRAEAGGVPDKLSRACINHASIIHQSFIKPRRTSRSSRSSRCTRPANSPTAARRVFDIRVMDLSDCTAKRTVYRDRRTKDQRVPNKRPIVPPRTLSST